MLGSRALNTVAFGSILTGLILLIWVSVVAPLQNLKTGNFENRANGISEMRKLQDRIAILQLEKSRLSDRGQLDVLWQAERTGTATAMIQAEISRQALQEGIGLRSISPVRKRDLRLADAVGIRIEMEAGLDQFTDFLRSVEYHSPALLVERAALRRLIKPGNQSEQPLVFAQIDLSAPVILSIAGQP